MTESIFQLENLTFAYKNQTVPLFKNFSLNLNREEALSIIGRSGCGKSTLLKLIFGILKAQSGKVCLHAEKTVYLSQEEALIPSHSVYKNLLLPLRLKGLPVTEKIRMQAKQILEDVGLGNRAESPVCELSGGMRKRLELARALLQNPDLLLMDEPFASLDVLTRRQMISLCKVLQHRHHFSLVFVTHHPEEAALLAHQIVVLAGTPLKAVYQAQFSASEKVFSSETDPFSLPKEDRDILSRVYLALSTQNTDLTQTPQAEKIIKFSSLLKRGIRIFCIAVIFFLLISLGKFLFRWPDYLIPYPAKIAEVFFSTAVSGEIFPDLLHTVFISGAGFFAAWLISIPLGYITAASEQICRKILPPIVILNTLPVIALAPFFLLWFGLGIATKILITLLIIFFPLLLSSRQAFYNARRQTFIHRCSFPGNPLRTFIYLEWPYALNTLFSAWRTALNGSIVGAVVSEFILGSAGLGALINLSKSTFDITMMFTALIWLGFLGIFYHVFIDIVEKLWIKKQAL